MNIGRYNSNDTNGALYSSREHAYTFIGAGLTATEITAHNNAVDQLQIDLGRQV